MLQMMQSVLVYVVHHAAGEPLVVSPVVLCSQSTQHSSAQQYMIKGHLE
jgi:hypothetical protein